MEQSPEVIVVGAGVVGCATAYYLSIEGVKVLMLEQDAVGRGSSGHATGSLNMLGSEFAPDWSFQMGLESYRMARDLAPVLEEETGIDLLFQRRAALRLALEEDEEQLIRTMMDWQQDYIPVRWIDGAEVRTIENRLSPSIRGAVYQDESIQLDAHRLTQGLARAAELHGARVNLGSVTGLKYEGSRVIGVRSSEGDFNCHTVVLALGPWSAACSSWLGFPVPVRSLKGERLLMTYDGEPLPVLISSPRRGHMISRLDGFLSVGSTGGRDHDQLDRFFSTESDQQPTEEARIELQRRAVEVFPALESAKIVQQLAGPRPLSPDGAPIIGPVPGTDGVLLATGHGTKGVHLAPVTGKIIADWVVGGRPELPFSIDHCLPERFAGQQ